MRTDKEVVDQLQLIYRETFRGKSNARYLIDYDDLYKIYGDVLRIDINLQRMIEIAARNGLAVFPIDGFSLAVMPRSTLERWRKVPRKIIEKYKDESFKVIK